MARSTHHSARGGTSFKPMSKALQLKPGAVPAENLTRPRGRPRKSEGVVATAYRVQIRLTKRGHDRLVRVQEISEASTSADVVRDAIRVYEVVVEAIAAGKHVVIEDPKHPDAPRERLRVL